MLQLTMRLSHCTYVTVTYLCISFNLLCTSSSALVWGVIGSNDDAALPHPPYLHAMSQTLINLDIINLTLTIF